MTTERETERRKLEPDSKPIITLPPDHLACIDCGLAVPLSQGAKPILVSTTTPTPHRPAEVRFLRCRECQDLTDMAAEAIAQLPSLSARLGEHSAIHQLASSLLALTVLGQELPTREQLADRATVRALIHHLNIGAAARWVGQYAPVLTRSTKACTEERWEYLEDDLLANLRTAYAGLLAERVARVAPPLKLAPPAAPDADLARGCLYCGVALLAVDGTEVVRVGGQETARTMAWRPISVATPSCIGAPISPEPVKGWLCPRCALAIDEAGVVGQSSMEKALRQHLKDAKRSGDLASIAGSELDVITSWAGLVLRQRRRNRPTPPANAQPWGHLIIA